MSHSPEQMRKKAEAMAESVKHATTNVVGQAAARYEREENMENGKKIDERIG